MDYLKLFQTHQEYETFVSGGTMMKPNVSHCISENEVHYNPWTWAEQYLTFVAKEDGTFQLSTNAVNYSLDNGETWTELAANTPTPTVTAGDKIMWKGELTPSSSNGIGTFSSTGQFEVKGNIMSLISGDSFTNADELTEAYTFSSLFFQCTGLTSAENLILPATTLAENCYRYMFQLCTSLTTAPELPATTLKSFCYSRMFSNCQSLATAPELPATTLAIACYEYMFNGCKSLTTAPELPATTLAGNCYSSMFNGCTRLTTAPELPATTLVSQCYNNMFNGCTNLNYIKAMFTTTPSTTYTANWVSGVASNGTFVKNAAASWTTTGVNGIPTGWTVQTASA